MESMHFTATKSPPRPLRAVQPPTPPPAAGRAAGRRGAGPGGGGDTLRARVPATAKAGDVITINLPTGRVLSVAVPAGLAAGDCFDVRVPPPAAPHTLIPHLRKTSSLALQRQTSAATLTRKFRYLALYSRMSLVYTERAALIVFKCEHFQAATTWVSPASSCKFVFTFRPCLSLCSINQLRGWRRQRRRARGVRLFAPGGARGAGPHRRHSKRGGEQQRREEPRR